VGKLTNAVNPFKAQSQGFGGRMRQMAQQQKPTIPTGMAPPPKIQPGVAQQQNRFGNVMRQQRPMARPQPQMAQQQQMASQLRRPMMGRRR